MAFYIVFNNFSSFLDESNNAPDSTQDIPATIDDSIEKVIQDAPPVDDQPIVPTEPEMSIIFEVEDSAEIETSVSPEVEVSIENPVLTIENSEIVAVNQTVPTPEPNIEKPELAPNPQILEIETKVAVQNDNYEKYHSLLKKFEISLRYRYDFTDIFKNNRETENSYNLSKLNEKNSRKERDRQREMSERRFQEKQAENFRESLKQKLFASQLQNKNK